jgi:hypothetical protein
MNGEYNDNYPPRFAQVENVPDEGDDPTDNFDGGSGQPERDNPETNIEQPRQDDGSTDDIDLPEQDAPDADDTSPEWPEGGR